MSYWDLDVIVEGALDDSETFEDTQRGRLARATFLGNLEREARRETFRAEVFELYHDHDLSEGDDDERAECSCAQYVTDHHPTYTFGPEGRTS